MALKGINDKKDTKLTKRVGLTQNLQIVKKGRIYTKGARLKNCKIGEKDRIDIKGTWLTKNGKIDTEDVKLKKYKIDKKGKIERCKIDTKSIYTKKINIHWQSWLKIVSKILI